MQPLKLNKKRKFLLLVALICAIVVIVVDKMSINDPNNDLKTVIIYIVGIFGILVFVGAIQEFLKKDE